MTTDPDGTRVLEATDRYKAVRVPVQAEDGDVDGLISVDALKGAKTSLIRGASHTSYVNRKGAEMSEANPLDGQYPNLLAIFGGISPTVRRVCFNARFLYEIAQALGDDEVIIDLPESPIKPMRVQAKGQLSHLGEGLLMPIRFSA